MSSTHAALAGGKPLLAPRKAGFLTLALGSVGVVYGDIGTSPLYAFKESLRAAAAGGAATRPMVLGVISLMLWALIIVVTLKYVLLIMRADNRGEGGTLALMALLQRASGLGGFVVLGMIGAALFYGDAIITPAISVLSAMEGLELVSPALEAWVLPLSVAILAALFLVQHHGTASVAAWFGPITAFWFVAMAAGGLLNLADDWTIVAAINPLHGVRFLLEHGHAGLLALGAVFLTVTGAEALYADMGHFGRRPIRVTWIGFVLPCLALNYLGQGALLLDRPEAIENPFFLLYPGWALLPMVALATAATIIASQAVITGAYSLTQQAIQLGLMPRTEIRPTSETLKGQIYVPKVNMLLLAAVLFVVVMFQSSGALGTAYGIAVTGTMVVTTIMIFFVLRRHWRWPLAAAAILVLPFLVVDLIFLAANTLKIAEGGWLPLAVGGFILLVMVTWRRGTGILAGKAAREEIPLSDFISAIGRSGPPRVDGVAVFLTGEPDFTPRALLHNLKHNKVLHQENVIVSVVTADVPRVEAGERGEIEELPGGFFRARLRFGFMEEPNVPLALRAIAHDRLSLEIMRTSFFLSRRTLRLAAHSPMPRWQDRLFIALARSADDASRYFGIPSDRAVEIGMQVKV